MDKDKKIRLLMVDDHPIFRDGIKARLMRQAHLKIVGEASDGREAVDKVQKLSPDVVIMDIGLPGMNGLEATKRVCQIAPQTRVLILTVYDNKEYALQAFHSGARGYILKNMPSTELIHAVEAVHRGELFFPGKFSQIVMEEYAQEAGKQDRSKLSRREREVLTYIAEGYTNKETAEKLSLSVRTIETHRERIMRKLDVHTAAGLAKYAIIEGLIPLK